MVAVLFDVGAPFLGEVDRLAPCGLLDSDEPFGNGLTKSWEIRSAPAMRPAFFGQVCTGTATLNGDRLNFELSYHRGDEYTLECERTE